jgi:hypothetical protein
MDRIMTIQEIPNSFGNKLPPADHRIGNVWLYTPSMIRSGDGEYDVCLTWGLADGNVHWLNGFKGYFLPLVNYPETDGEHIFFQTQQAPDAEIVSWEIRPTEEGDIISLVATSGLRRSKNETPQEFVWRVQYDVV